MKLCSQHWDMLKKACEARGMSHLIAKDGKEAVDAMVREMEGESDPKKDFDPLMKATWMICGRALQEGGLYLMFTAESGQEYCPTCEAIMHHGDLYLEEEKQTPTAYPTIEAYWTEGVMDSLLQEARDLGLMPKLS